MFGKPKDLDRVVHSRALDRARWAIRDHGDQAEAFIEHKLQRPGLSDADRILHRLTLRAIAELRRDRERRAHALVHRKPPSPVLRFLAGLFTPKRKRRRRRS